MAVAWQHPTLPIYRLRGQVRPPLLRCAGIQQEETMSVFVIGGTGFIGTRVIRLLAARGEEIVCMDINPGAASFEDLGKQVRVLRGDVTQFDDVMAATLGSKPSRIINLSYFLGSEHPPHIATKLNIVGMDNCFEAARLAGVQRVV